MTLTVFLSILSIHLIAAMSPGPSFVVSVRTAASEGFRPAFGLAVAFGLGAVIWALAALSGLSILFDIFPRAYLAFKLAGGLFLIWIGYKTFRHAADPLPEASAMTSPRSLANAFRLGLMTQLSNPKPAVFFGAVFAGLVPPETSVVVKAVLLFFVFFDETLWYVIVARLFSRQKARQAYGRAKLWTDRVLGGLIAVFGLRIATS
ncbi:LysE family translocator [Celeribacter persicus]|uniref:Threonine/homoserine/homoserine lactone efflux protein n=1 Tax=Celeribacter persicus TaxID=1651082 RepID=A0A2T5HBD8_9RHOB|nr:LysE family translocator [Celeribacter persicus]PTQ68893.1 threonine/homoserine/homoserine lactone efflux protein [Celeribacter persicus]